MSLVTTITQLNLKGEFKFQKKLAPLTRFKVGGAAEIFYIPYDKQELSYFLKSLPAHVPVTFIGNGSNILVSDDGLEGVVIKLGKNFASIDLCQDHVYVGAAALNWKFAKICMHNGIANFEFAEWIPGSVGGGIIMNAGSYGHEFCDSIVSVEIIDRLGNIKTLSKNDITFGYRKTSIPPSDIIVGATFAREYKNPALIRTTMVQFYEQKKSTQPIFAKTAGSTFTNPKEKKAWQYITESGSANMRIGDAIWSPHHPNFALNQGNATFKDFENLIFDTREKIYKKFSLTLDLEVKILGKNKLNNN